MSRFFRPNIGYQSRLVRGVVGTTLLMLGITLASAPLWTRLLLVGAGLFAIFEAVRGWCVVHACGFRAVTVEGQTTHRHE